MQACRPHPSPAPSTAPASTGSWRVMLLAFVSAHVGSGAAFCCVAMGSHRCTQNNSLRTCSSSGCFGATHPSQNPASLARRWLAVPSMPLQSWSRAWSSSQPHGVRTPSSSLQCAARSLGSTATTSVPNTAPHHTSSTRHSTCCCCTSHHRHQHHGHDRTTPLPQAPGRLVLGLRTWQWSGRRALRCTLHKHT